MDGLRGYSVLLLLVAVPAACGGETGRDHASVAQAGSGAQASSDGGAPAGGADSAGSGGSGAGTGGVGGSAGSSGGSTGVGGSAGSSGGSTGVGGGYAGSSGSGGGSAGEAAGGMGGSDPTCPTPLAQETIDQLSLAPLLSGGIIELGPGDSYGFSFFTFECCYFEYPVEACATWSVTPTAGATIDPATGLFTVDPDTPGGRVFTVTGDVENGRHVDSIDVYVVTPETHPLVGNWGEDVRYDCDTGAEMTPDSDRIGEVLFHANGLFSVTWFPFEVYKDYWGSYSFDLDSGTVELTIDTGNHIPDDVDRQGTFAIDSEGRLVLRDLWLGSSSGATTPAACGHRLIGGFASDGTPA